MAIQKKHTNNKTGLEVENAYYFINYIQGISKYKEVIEDVEIEKYDIIVMFDVFISKEAKEDKKEPIENNIEIEFKIDKKEFEKLSLYELIYQELKKLPEYKSAIDI